MLPMIIAAIWHALRRSVAVRPRPQTRLVRVAVRWRPAALGADCLVRFAWAAVLTVERLRALGQS